MKTKQPKPIHWKKKIPEGTFSIFFSVLFENGLEKKN